MRPARLAALVPVPFVSAVALILSGACGRIQEPVAAPDAPGEEVHVDGVVAEVPAAPDTTEVTTVDSRLLETEDTAATIDATLETFDAGCTETLSLQDLSCVTSTVDASCLTDAIPETITVSCDAMPLGTPDACVGLVHEPFCKEPHAPICPTASYPRGCILTFPRPHPYYPCEPIARFCEPDVGWVLGL